MYFYALIDSVIVLLLLLFALFALHCYSAIRLSS